MINGHNVSMCNNNNKRCNLDDETVLENSGWNWQSIGIVTFSAALTSLAVYFGYTIYLKYKQKYLDLQNIFDRNNQWERVYLADGTYTMSYQYKQLPFVGIIIELHFS